MNALFPPPADTSTIKLRVLSLGAGVQSTTLALMAAHGEIGPMPDCAIFADTGWEPKAVYEHLAWLRSPNVLPLVKLPHWWGVAVRYVWHEWRRCGLSCR